MPLQDTDVTLVSRGSTNANATIAQLKSHITDGITSYLTWSAYPTTNNQDISSPNKRAELTYWLFSEIEALQFKDKDLGFYNDGDVIVLHNMARSNAGTYRVTGRNNSTNSLEVEYIATAYNLAIEIGDKINITNLGPDVDTDTGNEVFIQDTQPETTDNGDLWYQPATGLFHIYNNGWERINSYNGEYYKNVVDDLGIDNSGTTNVSGKVQSALTNMFDSGARTGTLYFPAGTYLLEARVLADVQGNNNRSGWVIKGDGTATKFYVKNPDGGIYIKFFHKDNYLTIQDLAIHPLQVVTGSGLYLQNGPDAEAADPPDIEPDDNDYLDDLPSGGSNQQYGVQLINVNVLSDRNKPNNEKKKSDEPFFKNNVSLINFGRPRLSRCIFWNHAERSVVSFANPKGINYSGLHDIEWTEKDENGNTVNKSEKNYPGYGFAPEEVGVILNLTNCYSPWIDNCYINGTAKYGIFWNSTRSNTEGGTLTKLVINGPDIGCWVSQTRREQDYERDPLTGEPVLDVNGDRIYLFDNDGNPIMYDRQGRHPHLTFIDSHINSAKTGLYMNNVKYFHIADILFYARNDRYRDDKLIDVHCVDCHSGYLANGYSGGAVGNEDKKPVPPNQGYELDEAYITGSGKIAINREANGNQRTKAPWRVHVLLEGTENALRGEEYLQDSDGNLLDEDGNKVEDTGKNPVLLDEGVIIKNRQILVEDHTLNALICRIDKASGRTLAQKRPPSPFTTTITTDMVEWDSPYQVVGTNADITFNLPDFNYEDNPAGAAFDRSQYPPQHKMISAEEGIVNFSFGGHTRSGIITSDLTTPPSSEQIRRLRLDHVGGGPVNGEIIARDGYYTLNSDQEMHPYVATRVVADDVTRRNEYGSMMFSLMRDGEWHEHLLLRDGTTYLPYDIDNQKREDIKPVISFAEPKRGYLGNQPAGIYYISGGINDLNERLEDAPIGSLAMHFIQGTPNSAKLMFKTALSGGWREVNLL